MHVNGDTMKLRKLFARSHLCVLEASTAVWLAEFVTLDWVVLELYKNVRLIVNTLFFMVKTKAVYIVTTFEQLIHLFITICAEKKGSVSQVIPSANRMLFSKRFFTIEGKLKKADYTNWAKELIMTLKYFWSYLLHCSGNLLQLTFCYMSLVQGQAGAVLRNGAQWPPANSGCTSGTPICLLRRMKPMSSKATGR